MSKSRPAIRSKIARAVRKECYYGCVLCGSPIFQYDHIEEYSVVKEHSIENLALLCPSHHNEKTTFKLSAKRVKQARENPFNKNRIFSGSHQQVSSDEISVELGTDNFFHVNLKDGQSYQALWINGTPVCGINSNDGWLTISLILTDFEGNILLRIDKGELVLSLAIWDYEYIGNKLTIKEGLGQIILEMELTNDKIKVNYGQFLDTFGTGFIIRSPVIMGFIRGIKKYTSAGSRYPMNSNGGIALLDIATFPNILEPSGFGAVLSS